MRNCRPSVLCLTRFGFDIEWKQMCRHAVISIFTIFIITNIINAGRFLETKLITEQRVSTSKKQPATERHFRGGKSIDNRSICSGSNEFINELQSLSHRTVQYYCCFYNKWNNKRSFAWMLLFFKYNYYFLLPIKGNNENILHPRTPAGWRWPETN